jgi:hypothetical protein
MKEPRLIGIAVFDQGAPQVAYLNEPVPLDDKVLSLAGPAEPREIFRIAAHCEESRCTHFGGGKCSLATRIVQILPAVVDSLPTCLIRGTCRWYTQEGKAACFRCPQVITQPLDPSAEFQRAAAPQA